MRTKKINALELLALLEWIVKVDLKEADDPYEELSAMVRNHQLLLQGVRVSRPVSEILTNPVQHALVMREYNREKRLVVACGNKPVLFENKTPEIFGAFHDHVGDYTMDLMLGMNPSVVGDFHNTDMRMIIPMGALDEIWFEGGGVEGGRFTMSNLKWLVKEGGVINLLAGTPDGDNSRFLYWNRMVKHHGHLILKGDADTLKKGDRITTPQQFRAAWNTRGYS